MKFLRRIGRKNTPEPAPFRAPPIAPEKAFVAIGDIHGQLLLAERLFTQIAALSEYQVVCVGDYVDRGEQSAQVLSLLHGVHNANKENTHGFTFLMGNHEEMMLNFLDDPARNGARWLRHGWLQTLASFGVRGVHQRAEEAQLIDARDALREQLGAEQEQWLRSLPRKWVSGNVAVVHAGADPAVPIENQADEVLTWGHPDFMRQNRTDGMWVVHGHTIMPEPQIRNGRISIDTGAYATGQLTAAKIEAGKVEFLNA